MLESGLGLDRFKPMRDECVLLNQKNESDLPVLNC